jgi:microcystin-dependent protein
MQEGEKVRIQLSQMRAVMMGGTRGTRIMLKYQNLLHAGNSVPFSGFREIPLNIVNHRGKRNIPLHVGFVGANTVLNDGEHSNTLRLRITNSSRKNETLAAAADSKFVLVAEGGPQSEEWALATDGQLNGIELWVTYPGQTRIEVKRKTSINEWEMPFKPLKDNEFIDVLITKLITKHPMGHANLYLHHENIPSYWDGQFVLVVEKSPLVFDKENVGIGTSSPEAKLHVDGNFKADGELTLRPDSNKRGIEVLSPSAGNTHIPYVNNWNYISGAGVIFRRFLDGAYTERMRIDYSTGNVGIGTNNPSETLEVIGNVKAQSFIGQGALVRGMIIMWSGAINAIPNGWALCNGQNGTPDLRDRFVVATGSTYNPGNTGGQDSVTLSANQMPAHSHSGTTSQAGNHQHRIEGTDAEGLTSRKRTITGTTTVDMGWGGGRNADPNDVQWRGHVNTDTTGGHSHSFSTDSVGGNAAHENRPRYYALAFIMKL